VTNQVKWAVEHTLQRATHRLDNLDYPSARQILTTWVDTEEVYPYGGARRAALLAEAGDTELATQIAKNTLDQILEAQAGISHSSIRLRSEERWIRNLLSQFQKARKFRRDRDEIELQPEPLQDPEGLGGNPIDRLEKVRGSLEKPPPDLSSGRDVTPNFDLGNYKTSYELGGPDLDDFRPAFAYVRMKEKGGLPLRIERVSFARDNTTNAANWIRPIKPAWSWSLLARLAEEKSFRKVLTRKRVSGLSEQDTRELFEKAYRGVKTSAEDLGGNGDEAEVARDRLKGLIDFLSRLSVRRDMNSEKALELAVRLSKNADLQSDASIYGKLGDLLERSTLALPDELVRDHIDDIFSIPLVGRDLTSAGTIGRWFDPADKLPQIDLAPGDIRAERVSRLIAVLEDRSPVPPNTDPKEERSVARLFASARLRYLYRCGGLSDEHIEAFASAYWEQSDNPDGLPDLFGVTANFSLDVPPPPRGPSRSERVRNAVLNVEDLTLGDQGMSVPTPASDFISTLRGASMPVSGQVPNGAERIRWDSDESKKLLGLLAEIWDSDSDRYTEERNREVEHGAFLISSSDVIRRHLRLIPLALREAVFPSLDEEQASEVHRITDEMNDLGFAMAIVYPDLLRLNTVSTEEARKQIQQHLAAENNWSIEVGARAVEQWVRLWDEEKLNGRPERLIRDLVNHIVMRRRPGLTPILKVVANIVEEIPSAIGLEHVSELSSTLTSLREETAPPSSEEAWQMPEIEENKIRSREERAATVSLASALKDWYAQKEGKDRPEEVDTWQEIAQNSPMPEVYEAWNGAG